jgi:hypothetical protein
MHKFPSGEEECIECMTDDRYCDHNMVDIVVEYFARLMADG